jgi:hypothetical protein
MSLLAHVIIPWESVLSYPKHHCALNYTRKRSRQLLESTSDFVVFSHVGLQ